MHRRGWLTPAETRLAGLLLGLSILGGVVRVGDRVSPEVERWLEGEGSGGAGADSTTPPPEPAAPAAPVPPAAPPTAAAAPDREPPHPEGVRKGIDPNTADLNGLLRLPGVGPALARRILEDRGRNGPYRGPEDLLRVRGIGPATLDKMRPDLRF